MAGVDAVRRHGSLQHRLPPALRRPGHRHRRHEAPGPVAGRRDRLLLGEAVGLIRANEIQAGVIPHALFLVIKSGSSGSVYPAYKADATGNQNGPPMGQRFPLNMSDSAIDASCAPGWEKTVAKAMSHYGLYFGDTGGSGFSPMMESQLTYTAVGQANPWDAIAAQYGIRQDPTYGYVFRWSGCIDYRAAMQAIAPPAA